MTEHPEDTPVKRFLTFWWALGAILVFGMLLLVIAGTNSVSGGAVDEYAAQRAAERKAKLVAVREAEGKLLNAQGTPAEVAGKIRIPVDVAAQVVLKELQSAGAPKASAVPVPGTKAMEELLKKQAAEAAAAAEAEAAKKDEAKPAEAKPKEE